MNLAAEWLESDGLGGFASGTVGTLRTRRYHGLLLSALTPPTARAMLVPGIEAWVEGEWGRVPLVGQRYAPDVVHPDITAWLTAFTRGPWPTWTYTLPNGGVVAMEVLVARGMARTYLRWTARGAGAVVLHVRPLLATRDYHGLQRENGAAKLESFASDERVIWQLYDGASRTACASNGRWRDDPTWFRQFLYADEQARGLDAIEDLASPGELSFDLGAMPAVAVLGMTAALGGVPGGAALISHVEAVAHAERARRLALGGPLEQSADTYFVKRGSGRSIVAGYPWFTDWGRDTFIAMRGLCLATGRLDEGRDILLAWAGAVDRGMVPNRFPDGTEPPEYNSVDASLWFVVVCHELLTDPRAAAVLTPHDRRHLEDAIVAVLDGYASGTRYGISADEDGLLRAGEPGQQLTWMDARANGREITPRIGKPVEIQALWVNALAAGSVVSHRWTPWMNRARRAFAERFVGASTPTLPDVVDVDHRPGVVDATVRPNQILAIGGLPVPLLDGPRARQIVATVEARLWTPLGLRSLAPGEPGYTGRYEGGPAERDAVYHQGTVWPWLLGPFVEAWVRVRGGGVKAQRDARRRFLTPVLAHLDEAGLGHVSEIADADPPHPPRGCPFQAWSLGELLRLDRRLAGRVE
jgi:predicted glycogen debranching enzyme